MERREATRDLGPRQTATDKQLRFTRIIDWDNMSRQTTEYLKSQHADVSSNLLSARNLALATGAVAIILWCNLSTNVDSLRKFDWQYIGLGVIAGGWCISEHRRRKLENHLNELNDTIVVDPVTGLANRNFLNQELRRHLSQFQRQDSPFSIMLFDINDFRQINMQFGYEAGDSVLRSVTSVVKASVRDMDSLIRYGSDSFIAVLPGTKLTEAEIIAKRVSVAISDMAVPYQDRWIRVTANAGVATAVPLDVEESILCRAEQSLEASQGNDPKLQAEHYGESHFIGIDEYRDAPLAG